MVFASALWPSWSTSRSIRRLSEKLMILSDAAGEAASPQIRNAGHHRGQYMPAAVLLVFSLVELHLPAQGRSGLLHRDGRRPFSRHPRSGDRVTSSIRRTPRRRWSRWVRRSRSPDQRARRRCLWKNSLSCHRSTTSEKIFLTLGEIVTEISRAHTHDRKQRLLSQSARAHGVGSRHRLRWPRSLKAAVASCASGTRGHGRRRADSLARNKSRRVFARQKTSIKQPRNRPARLLLKALNH